AFSPDQRWLLAGGARLRLWDLQTGSEVNRFEDHSQTGVFERQVAFSHDGTRVISMFTRKDGTSSGLRLWSMESGKLIREFPPESGARSFSLAPDSATVLTSAGSGAKMVLWDLENGMEKRSFKVTSDYGTFATLSPDGQ